MCGPVGLFTFSALKFGSPDRNTRAVVLDIEDAGRVGHRARRFARAGLAEQVGVLTLHPGFDFTSDGLGATLDGLGCDLEVGI
jgi:hypothetical protein